MRGLLAEAERELATWPARAIQQSGFRVDWVDDGRIVRRSLKATRYEALILDLGLPGPGGHEVLADLREADHRLPVLVLTARDSLVDRIWMMGLLTATGNGRGIPAPELARAGEHFFRDSNAGQPGSGFGLALARSIAERHGGALALLAASEGTGLVARISLPLKR